MAERPRRTDVVAAYDLGVEAYDVLWSPVILPPAVAVVEALALAPDACVVDVGAGAGGLLPTIRACAPASTVIAVDASLQMLRTARTGHGATAVQADALHLPVAGAVADAVLLAFVLFHLGDPVRGLAEAARVLRRGGRVGTVTWTTAEGNLRASAQFDRVLTDAGAPLPPVRRVDTGLESAGAVEGTLGRAGFAVDEVWLVELRKQWARDDLWALLLGGGVNRTRLAALDDAARAQALARGRAQLDDQPAEAFSWWGEVVCAVATKAAGS
jgi:SAM-dependent methyltransferase